MTGNRLNSQAGKIFDTINTLFMVFILLIMVLPFYYILVNSLTPDAVIMKNGYAIIPGKLTLNAYRLLLTSNDLILRALGVSVFVTVIGTFADMLVTVAFAYSLSRRDLPGRKAIMIVLIISMVFSGGIIPYFIVVKNLHLMDSLLVYIIPSLVNPFFVILVRNYLMDIPEALRESALIDGAKEFRILAKVIIPLAKPVIATIALFYAVGNWNKWYEALMFIKNRDLYTLQYHLYLSLQSASYMSDKTTSINAQNDMFLSVESMKFATVIIAITPIILVYPFAQKYFVKGIMIGSVKG